MIRELGHELYANETRMVFVYNSHKIRIEIRVS